MANPNEGITIAQVRAGTKVLKYDPKTKNDAVKTVQILLNNRGYDCGTPDGVFGGGTQTQVKKFQTNNNLASDGIVGKGSLAKMEASNTGMNYGVTLAQVRAGTKALRYDIVTRSDAVKEVQNLLNANGFNCGTADGMFGSGMKNQVIAFQTSKNLGSDGIVGKGTLAKLESYASGPNYGVTLAQVRSGSKVLKYDTTTVNDTIKQIQTMLNSKNLTGINCGTPDGMYGGKTVQAVRKYQVRYSLTSDGVVGQKTLTTLESASTGPNYGVTFAKVRAGTEVFRLDMNTVNNDVMAIQNMLNAKGINCGTPDGAYGKDTVAAIKIFQGKMGISSDGIVGKVTLAKLESSEAVITGPNYGITLDMVRAGKILKYDTHTRSDDIVELQLLLKAKGFDCGSADGIYGGKTRDAVKAYQISINVTDDGILGKMTLAGLEGRAVVPSGPNEGVTLAQVRSGDKILKYDLRTKSDAVASVQEMLLSKGYDCGKADGIFGGGTQDAVIDFQDDFALSRDGKVGAITLAKLESNELPNKKEEEQKPVTPPVTTDFLSYAIEVISANEGHYDSVRPDDNGSLSIGLFQWHGSRAHALLKTIRDANPAQAQTILSGTAIYAELSQAASTYDTKILTSYEASKVEQLIGSKEGRIAQDNLKAIDIQSYIDIGRSRGISDEQALIYYADLENQGPKGAKRITESLTGAGKTVNLENIHAAALVDSALGGSHSKRRNRTYEKAKMWRGATSPAPNPGSSANTEKIVSIAIHEFGLGIKENKGDNRTKYGEWYGNNGQAWCASFACWCANEAGILDKNCSQKKNKRQELRTGLVPEFSYTPTGKNFYKEVGRYVAPSTANPPHAGDLIFFYSSKSDDKRIVHVGIVEAYDPSTNTVYTIEGNASDTIQRKSYTNNDKYYSDTRRIDGYGTNGSSSYGTVPNGASSGDDGKIV